MITYEIAVHFVLTFITIRGESCNWFRGSENIAMDPATCRMETSATPHGINSCLGDCDKNSEVTYIS